MIIPHLPLYPPSSIYKPILPQIHQTKSHPQRRTIKPEPQRERLVGTSPYSRAGDGVGGGAAVQVVYDSGLGLGVKSRAGDTGGGSHAAGAGDLEVEALHVELGTVLAPGAVESDDLVAEDVVAGLKVPGDRG